MFFLLLLLVNTNTESAKLIVSLHFTVCRCEVCVCERRCFILTQFFSIGHNKHTDTHSNPFVRAETWHYTLSVQVYFRCVFYVEHLYNLYALCVCCCAWNWTRWICMCACVSLCSILLGFWRISSVWLYDKRRKETTTSMSIRTPTNKRCFIQIIKNILCVRPHKSILMKWTSHTFWMINPTPSPMEFHFKLQ